MKAGPEKAEVRGSDIGSLGAFGVDGHESDDGEEENVKKPGPGVRKRPSGGPPAASASSNHRHISFFSRPYIRRCARCFLMELCEQYPAKSWTENDTLDTPVEYLCAVAHAQARYLGLITEQENAWEIMDWKERVDGFTAVP